MRSIQKIVFSLALCCLMCIMANARESSNVTAFTMQNGMKIIIRENHSINLAAVDIWVRAGTLYETPETNGISHFIEHMIFKTTAKFPSGQIDREIEGMGAQLNGGTSRDWVHFYTTAASEYLPSVLGALADAITSAQFKPDEVEKERQVILDEIARSESIPTKRAMDLFANIIYGTHPYSLPPAGSKDVINKLTRDELYAFYKKKYSPSNICVVIAGDITPEAALETIKNSFGDFATKGSATPADEPPPMTVPTQSQAFSCTMPYADSHVILGFITSPASDLKNACALDILRIVIGDTNGGRIASAFDSAGIKYKYINTDYINQKYPSAFSIHAIVRPEDVEKASSYMLAELQQLAKQPISQEELAYAQRIVQGEDLFQQETFAGQARSLGMYEQIGSWELALNYGTVTGNLTADDILHTAAQYFSKDNYTLLITEPEGHAN